MSYVIGLLYNSIDSADTVYARSAVGEPGVASIGFIVTIRKSYSGVAGYSRFTPVGLRKIRLKFFPLSISFDPILLLLADSTTYYVVKELEET